MQAAKNESVVTVSGLLNSVWIVKGSVANKVEFVNELFLGFSPPSYFPNVHFRIFHMRPVLQDLGCSGSSFV